MPTAEEAAREVIDRLPDETTLDEIAYGLYVNEKIEQSLADATAGRTVSHDALKRDPLGAMRIERPHSAPTHLRNVRA